MRKFFVSDIHGNYRALKQVLELSNFDYQNDLLICGGDITDGWSEMNLVIDELLKINNFILLKGNHDDWSAKYEFGFNKTNKTDYFNWCFNGGQTTIQCYKDKNYKYRKSHLDFLRSAQLFHVEDSDIFVHAGIPNNGALNCNPDFYFWDRTYVIDTLNGVKTYLPEGINRIFVGHTTTQFLNGTDKPIIYKHLYCCDTGAAFEGKLTLFDFTNNNYYQSENSKQLYPNENGRN